MKKLVYILLFLPIAILAQTQTENYVLTKTYKVKTQIPISNSTKEKASKSIQYFDGLGRLKQSILIEGGGIVRQQNDALYDWTMNNMGSTGFYTQEGTDAENTIVSGTTPFGNQDLLWECKGDQNDGSSQGDGGWITDPITIDKTKAYRYSVWVKRTGSQNGSTLIGTQTVSGLDGTNFGEIYFFNGDLPQIDTWYLFVGIIHPYDYSGTDSNVGGVYDKNGNKVLDAVEFKWQSTSTIGRFRSYLFFATDPNVRQYFWSPVIQKIDGSELSINNLVNTPEVIISNSTRAKDIVTHYEYDGFGRQTKEYLPYASNTSSGSFLTGDIAEKTKLFYKTKYTEDFAGVNLPNINVYSEKALDNSPLNRVFEQGAPGKDWKINKSLPFLPKGYSDDSHTIKFEYDTNVSGEVKLYWVSTIFENNTYTPTLQGGTNSYNLGELAKTITKDENWKKVQQHPKDHTTEEFKNKQGQVILKRTYNNNIAHDTYYVYDDFGNLTYVLPPKSEADTDIPSTSELKELCYQYKYDSRNRLVEKKIPGKGWEYIVYDNLDRPVLTQDSILAAQDKWLFTKYDSFGRIAYTGEYINSASRTEMDSIVAARTSFKEQQLTTSNQMLGANVFYTYSAYPHTLGVTPHTINYYDNYVDLPAGFTIPTLVYSQPVTTNTKGLATVSKVRILNVSPQKWITTITFYDEKARPIYLYSHNEYLETTDITESKLDDFTGKVLETKTTHIKGNNSPIVTTDRFEYDHMDRLISQSQQINNQTSERILKNNYDELGQLESKLVGNGTKSGYIDVTPGVTIIKDTIVKIGSEGWYDGLATVGSFNGNGYVEYKTVSEDKRMMIGLSDKNESNYYSTIDYAIYNYHLGKRVYIYENGIQKTFDLIPYKEGDIFKIERVDGVIYYKKNEEVIYISTISSNDRLIGDVSLRDTGAKIKDLHIVDNENGLQKVDYKYNVRGWLTQINDTENLGTDLFSFQLNYNQQHTAAANFDNLYNGNISQTIWRTASDNQKRAYSYKYDALNRIAQGFSLKTESLMTEGDHSLWGLGYDKNGNITQLTRSGLFNGSGQMIDQLSYTYNNGNLGNKLIKVVDNAIGNSKFEGFKDTNTSGDDYMYDVNGNMVEDKNKGVTSITYNHLNLPVDVTFDNSVGNISYIYDATGVKQKKEVWSNSDGYTTTTDYTGNYTYVNVDDGRGEVLQFFNHPEGYINPKDENDLSQGFNYVYQYKDHLGNVRLSYTDNTKSYENIIDSNFEDSFDGWKQNGTVNYTLENGKLKANIDSAWEGIRYDYSDIVPGETYTVKIKFDKGNTQSNVLFYISYDDQNGNQLGYHHLNNNLQTGEYTFTYVPVSNTGDIRIHLGIDHNNPTSETQFYVDYVTFTRSSLDIVEESNYYPFGLKHKGYNNVTTSNGNSVAQKWGFTGKEHQDELGLGWIDITARNYDASLGRWMNIDPLAEDMRRHSPYNYAFNNPIFFIDPDGMKAFSTDVLKNEDGTYTVTSKGSASATDGDNNIYVVDNDGNRTGEVIGESLTSHSFYDDNGKAVDGAVIDTNSTEGQDFIDDEIIADNPSTTEYMPNATGGEKYDFKTRDIDKRKEGVTRTQHSYRGSKTKDGKFGSARDFGNIGAGIIAGKNIGSWTLSRIGFDGLQSYQEGGLATEGIPTQKAQKVGFKIGRALRKKSNADNFKRRQNQKRRGQ